MPRPKKNPSKDLGTKPISQRGKLTGRTVRKKRKDAKVNQSQPSNTPLEQKQETAPSYVPITERWWKPGMWVMLKPELNVGPVPFIGFIIDTKEDSNYARIDWGNGIFQSHHYTCIIPYAKKQRKQRRTKSEADNTVDPSVI